MSTNLKISEHESVEWILKKVPNYSRNIFMKNNKVIVTSFDVNADVFVIGTNTGYLYFISRKDNSVENFLLRKDSSICHIKIIQTIDLSIASGMENGSVYILKIPIKDKAVLFEANLFNVPADHSSPITSIAWSKNAEKLFTGEVNGNICFTEVNNIDKTVSSYRVCNTPSSVIYLSYNYKCLVVSTENENFIYNFSTNSILPIGSKSRHQSGKHGACFIDKLCRPEEIEIVVVRPDSKVWISNFAGVIKRTILLKNETLFSLEKSISVLPSLTSQSNADYVNKIQTGAIKYQLGLVNSISENEVLFWSKNGLIILDISTGKIVSSTCNLGIILSVTICHNYIPSESVFSTFPECKSSHQDLFEIWIFRKPIRVDESTLIRLSAIPLLTSKLMIDPLYYFSEAHDFKHSNRLQVNIAENISTNSSIQWTSVINEDVSIAAKGSEHWLPNFDINVSDKLQELTKKTKEILNISHEIFEKTNEGVEEALELTEEGLIIQFEKNFEDESALSNKSDVILDLSLEVKNKIIISNDSIIKHLRKNVRNIQFIDIENSSIEKESLESTSLTSDYIIDRQTATDVIERATQVLSKENWSFKEDISSYEPEVHEPRNLYDELYFSVNENRLSNSTEHQTFPKLYHEHLFESETEDLNNGKNYNNLNEDKEDFTVTTPINIGSPTENHLNNISFPESSSSDITTDYFQPTQVNDERSEDTIFYNNVEDRTLEVDPLFNNREHSQETDILKDKPILTNSILSKCNKWISHRGPTLSGYNKITSLSVNRRMIWLTDTKGSLHLKFRTAEEHLKHSDKIASDNSDIQWFHDSVLSTEKIFSSPEGVILWRDKAGDISVYTCITRIWTPRVVKEKIFLKTNWLQIMSGVKDVDIDNDMAVAVTRKGELQVINEISGRSALKKFTPSLTGHVTLATTFNGIIWCVTEIVDPDTKAASQHIFACLAKDEDGSINVSYWRTVPIPTGLVVEKEEHLGILGGSSAIKCIHLGNCDLAWILTFQNLCFFSKDISIENPTGEGVWYQISLNFLTQISTSNDENVTFGLDWTRVEKIFGYTEARAKRTNSNTISSSVLISVKALPKRLSGNGLVWVTCTEKNSPCILFESDKNLLGHGWNDCFANAIKKGTISSLPAILAWSSVTFGFKNVLWLINHSNEIFCYWKESRIRNITVPSSFGKIIQIAAQNCTVLLLTNKSSVFFRIGISIDNPIGTNWKEISNKWNINKESIKHVTSLENEIWLLTAENIFYNEDLRSLTNGINKKRPWKSLNDPFTNTFSAIQIVSPQLNRKFIWSISDVDGYVYLGIWNISKNLFEWIYIPGPRAISLNISDENVWIIEQFSGEVYVRCGIDWITKATGEYWIHVPISTAPVVCLSSSFNNDVVVIDCKERLLAHCWSVVKSNVIEQFSEDSELLDEKQQYKALDGDWELLN